ncbi:MAG: transcriptional repressor [Selenomonadaceae bacterium]|nr:transcriptional repressor [Selenomonadaceae bacterium]
MTDNAKIILETINNSNDHLTAEEIFFKLKEQSYKIVLPTVYNNLNTLYREGLIRKVSIEGQPDRYDKSIKHDHLICQKCGKISDFNFDDLTNLINEQLNDSIISYDLKVNYICDECKKNSN